MAGKLASIMRLHVTISLLLALGTLGYALFGGLLRDSMVPANPPVRLEAPSSEPLLKSPVPARSRRMNPWLPVVVLTGAQAGSLLLLGAKVSRQVKRQTDWSKVD